MKYAEGIYVGYRYFDKHDIAPQYPFGYGLSYTHFGYSDLKISPSEGSATRKSTVTLKVAQSKESAREQKSCSCTCTMGTPAVDRPVKELKAFRRVELSPGQSTVVSFTLDQHAFAYYSTQKKDWIAEPGMFDILVGSSSRDIRLQKSFELHPHRGTRSLLRSSSRFVP